MRSEQKLSSFNGLRGIAALAVVIGHLFKVFGGNPFPHFYLAVDIFFMMSGVVIALAYERKFVAGMTTWQFMKIRFWRLWPLYILGTSIRAVPLMVMLLAGMHFDEWDWRTLAHMTPNLVMLPSLPVKDGSMYPLNFPGWSLLFELLVNLAYVAAFPLLTNKRLAVIVGVSASVLIGLLLAGNDPEGGPTWSTFWTGVARVSFAFPLGVLMFRLLTADSLPKVSCPTPLLLVGALVVMAVPVGRYNPYPAIAMLLLCPLIVMAAMHTRSGRLSAAYDWFGQLSYPLYALHFPTYLLLKNVFERILHSRLDSFVPYSGFGVFGCVLVLTIVVERWFDRPVTAWLAGRRRGLR